MGKHSALFVFIAAALVLGGGLSAEAVRSHSARRDLTAPEPAPVTGSAAVPVHPGIEEEASRIEQEVALPALRFRFAAAHQQLEQQNWVEAAEQFEALAKEYEAARDTCWFLAGTAWLSAKQPQRAVTALEQVAVESFRRLESVWLLTRADEALGEHARALGRLAPLWNGSQEVAAATRIRALVRSADLAERAGDRKAANELRLRLWADHPGSPSAWRAGRTLRSKAIPLLARAERADALVNEHRDDEARAQTRRVLRSAKLPDPAACLAHLVNGKVQRKARRHRDVVQTLTPVVAQCEDAALLPRALYLLATSSGILDAEAGRPLWTRLAKEFPDHPFADDALYAASELDLRVGDEASALARLDELVKRYPEGDYTGEAYFRRFWIRWRSDAHDETSARAAVAAYEKATRARIPALAAHRARALYWSGRLAAEQGTRVGRAEADEAWATLLRDHPTTLYALWAEERLGERAERLAAARDASDGEPSDPLEPLADDRAWQAALELHRLGLAADSDAAFTHVRFGAQSPQTVLAVFHFLRQEGMTRAARSIPEEALQPVLQGPLNADSAGLWALHRPQSYRALLESAATRAEVEPDLFRGLVYRESRFNPRARSGAGALGLAQVMVPTAREQMRLLGLTLRDPSQLYDPRLNARVGASYLSRLLRLYDGRRELALAAYNGGQGRVTRWWKAQGDGEVDVFVESIPIEETRHYVMKVMESFAAYRSLRRHELLAANPRDPREG